MVFEGLSNNDLKRFWRYVIVGEDNDCWNWTGNVDRGGYGVISIKLTKATSRKAHRIMYSICNGEIPEGLVIMHICDNPSCCNPKHLRLGTQADNVQDCVDKHRRSPQDGDNNNRSVLNSIQVLEIKKLYESGLYSAQSLSDKFKVSLTAITYILKGKSWKETTGGVVIPENRKNRLKNKLTEIQVLEIKKMIETTDLNYKEIGNLYNITGSEVSLIALNKIWKDVGQKINAEQRETHTLGTKLSSENVLEIKRLLREGLTNQKTIASLFGVTPTHIWWIKTGKAWADVGNNDYEVVRGKKLNSNQVIQIRSFIDSGELSIKEISTMFNVCERNIYNIKNRITWKNI